MRRLKNQEAINERKRKEEVKSITKASVVKRSGARAVELKPKLVQVSASTPLLPKIGIPPYQVFEKQPMFGLGQHLGQMQGPRLLPKPPKTLTE